MRSVIIPVKNEQDTIGDTLDCFIKNGFESVEDTEIIIIDDSNPIEDYSFGIAQGYTKTFENFHLYRQRSGGGKSGALEEGIERASGEVIIFIDADIETFEIDWIDRLSEPIEEGRADIVKGSYSYEGEDVVTKRVAEPLLSEFFPEVDFERPLEGEMALSRDVIDDFDLLPGFQIESGLIIDIAMGNYRTEEVYLGKKIHGERRGENLKSLADEVHEAIFRKAIKYDRI